MLRLLACPTIVLSTTPSDYVMLGDHRSMTTPLEEPAITTPAAGRTPSKMMQLLRKRLRQLLRAAVGLAIFLAVAGPIFAIWWLTSLNGLPDIGDPFDVAEFRSFQVAEDQNAFSFLRRAQAKLTNAPQWPRAIDSSDPTDVWAEADPKVRGWVEENRECLCCSCGVPIAPRGSRVRPVSPIRWNTPSSIPETS